MPSIPLVILLFLVATIWAVPNLKNWEISLKSEVGDDSVKAIEEWITSKQGNIPDRLFHDGYKILFVEMDDKIRILFS